MKHAVFVIINLIFLLRESFSQYSPCPAIFEFKHDGSRFYGIITIPAPGNGITIMEVSIGFHEDYGDGEDITLGLDKDIDDVARDISRGKDIQYRFNFPQVKELPSIRNIKVNHQDICDGIKEENVYQHGIEHRFINPEDATYLSKIPLFRGISTPTPNRLPPPYTRRPPPPTRRPPPPTRRPSPPIPPSRPTPPVSQIPDKNVLIAEILKLLSMKGVNFPPTIFGEREEVPSRKTRPNDASWLSSMPTADTCGRQSPLVNEVQTTQLIIGGTPVKKGEFPWMVALFYYTKWRAEPVCGASLISDSYVITAAHCTKDQTLVYMELGRYNITDRDEESVEQRLSLNIFEHPEYIPNRAHGDVALIEIERVKFTKMIKPICLWGLGNRLDSVKQEGTVTGWGQIENDGPASRIPLKLSIRTVGIDICRDSDNILTNLASDLTFCAGGNKTGPCHGDSGSGFYMKHNNIWYLRGIISTSIGSQYTCNLDRYAVYVELANVLDWMKQYLMP